MPTAIALNCTLKPSSAEPSSTDVLLYQLKAALEAHGVTTTETIRIADHDVKPGTDSDMGEGDAWPDIRAKILAADILVFGTPIWLGNPSSVARRVLERLDAFLSETDDASRTPAFGKVAVAAIVGNEDGAHATTAQLFQALSDVGFTIPAQASVYWVGEAMQKRDYRELPEPPEQVAKTTAMAAANAAHLASLLSSGSYPGTPG